MQKPVQILFIFLLLLAFITSCENNKKLDVKADKVIVYKSQRRMQLLKNGEVIRTYKLALGDNPIGHKQQEGDEKTPEGNYTLDWRNSKSSCYKSLHISYPNKQDKARAKKLGVSPGGNIMIHGLLPSMKWLSKFHYYKDWTHGCIAVNNSEIDEIWKMVDNGTPIEIRK
jgi:murein L,D-transpeptidase YafK